MKFRMELLLLMLFLGGGVEVGKAAVPAEIRMPAQAARFRLSEKTDEIVTRMKEAELYDDSKAAVDHEAVIRSFVNSLNPAVKYYPKNEVPALEANAVTAKNWPAMTLCDGRILYLRFDALNEAALTLLRNELTICRQKGTAKGIIIDLRSCSSGDNTVAEKAALLLKENGRLTETAILISGKTQGIPEIFLRRSGVRLTLGAATAGQPSGYRKIMLKEGDCLLAPNLGDGQKTFAVKPVQPLVNAEAFPQSDVAVIQKNEKNGDRCLRTAADVLSGIIALRKLPEKR